MNVPLLLAPMAEISHRPFRELLESFGGCDYYYSEMISSPAFCAGGPFEAWYADAGPVPSKTVYQLVGSDPQKLAEAAALLDSKECAGIDLNMGCSAPAITRHGAGVRWMESIDRAGAMTALVRKAVKHRLSVKLRTGYSDDFDYLVRFCRRLQDEGVELITLHPRTAKEKFRRRCRWEYIPALRRELKIPVAGNGDISSAQEMVQRGGDCDAVMIGRLAVKQPWVFADAKALAAKAANAAKAETPQTAGLGDLQPGDLDAPLTAVTAELILETGLRFLALLARYQPPEFHLSRARRFFNYFCDNLKWGNYVKNTLNREVDLAGIERVWKAYFIEHEGEDI
ncbi:MAG: tRNA-dihydrouridine synthase family protein [Treponema sp.]|nr:tRNA-dihydrouridine synthase family protein [Treponema sp.]